MNRDDVAYLVLRIGVAFALLYAAIDGFVDPNAWIDYFPSFMQRVAPLVTLLHAFGLLEIVIALWVLSGKKIFIPSALAVLMLVAIVLFNVVEFQLLFRDLSIAAAALALAVISWPRGSMLEPSYSRVMS